MIEPEHVRFRRRAARAVALCVLLLCRGVHADQEATDDSSQGSHADDDVQGASQAQRERAKQLFSSGIALAQKGEFQQAKAHFLEAYEVLPHPIVLYNAALACLKLDEPQQALELLERALLASPVLSQDEERLVRRLRADLLQKSTATVESAEQGSRAPSDDNSPTSLPAGADTASGGAEVSSEPRQPVAAKAHPGSARAPGGSTSAASSLRQPDPSPTPPDHLAYWLCGASFALLASSGIVYYWNGRRHDQWEQTDRDLRDLQNELLERGQSPRDDAELRKRVGKNDDLLESIQRVDLISLALVIGGGVGLGSGAWLLFKSEHNQAGVDVVLGPHMALRYRF